MLYCDEPASSLCRRHSRRCSSTIRYRNGSQINSLNRNRNGMPNRPRTQSRIHEARAVRALPAGSKRIAQSDPQARRHWSIPLLIGEPYSEATPATTTSEWGAMCWRGGCRTTQLPGPHQQGIERGENRNERVSNTHWSACAAPWREASRVLTSSGSTRDRSSPPPPPPSLHAGVAGGHKVVIIWQLGADGLGLRRDVELEAAFSQSEGAPCEAHNG